MQPPPGAENAPDDGARAEALQRLDALGEALAKKRKAAIDGRRASGIEIEWAEDEEAYLGIDDYNRGHMQGGRYHWTKPLSSDGTLTRDVKTDGRSTILLNITAPYVDAGAAKVQEIMVPADDKPWKLGPTPIPEFTDAIKEAATHPLMQPGVQPPTEELARVKAELEQRKFQAEQLLAIATRRAEAAERRIDDWLTESLWQDELRAVIDDAARIGVGILKGPFPEFKRSEMWTPAGASVVREEIKPESRRIDAWNLYPDPLCGEDIHKGSYVWERDDITLKTLLGLRDNPKFIREQIDKVIEEGPQKAEVDSPQQTERLSDETPYEIWYYHGLVGKEDMEAANCECGDGVMYVPALLTMVNKRVIRAAPNPLQSGDFPYDTFCIKRRKGHWAGVGWARMLRPAQKGLIAAVRQMMDNAGISSGPQLIITDAIVPLDGVWAITPRKIWRKAPNATLEDMRQALLAINIECNQQELMAIIQFYIKVAEDITGLPLMLQGQQGKAPDTVGGMQLLNANMASGIRRIVRLCDRLIKAHITRYYKWLMQNGDKEEEKGLFIVEAKGSTALVERDVQNQVINSVLAQMSLNQNFGMDPRKVAKLILNRVRLNPDDAMFSEDEWRKIQEAQSQQPADPRIQVAQLNAQTTVSKTQMELQHESQENAADRQAEVNLHLIDAKTKTMAVVGDQEKADKQAKVHLAGKVIDARTKQGMQKEEEKVKNKFGSGL